MSQDAATITDEMVERAARAIHLADDPVNDPERCACSVRYIMSRYGTQARRALAAALSVPAVPGDARCTGCGRIHSIEAEHATCRGDE